jgi:putative flippase GtrA
VVSLGLDMGFMWLFIEMIGMHDLVSKLIVQVIVVVLNYVFSKLFVFAKK